MKNLELQLSEYIILYLGLDVDNSIIVDDVREIEDKKKFIELMKESTNNVRLDYKNALQKLEELKKMYNEKYNSQLELPVLQQKAYDLANKIIQCFTFSNRDVFLDEKFDFSIIVRIDTRECVFNGKETYILDKINKKEYYDLCQDRKRLEMSLFEIYKKEAKLKKKEKRLFTLGVSQNRRLDLKNTFKNIGA